jgi:hypothetical protein
MRPPLSPALSRFARPGEGQSDMRASPHLSPGAVTKQRREPWAQGLRLRPPEAYPA